MKKSQEQVTCFQGLIRKNEPATDDPVACGEMAQVAQVVFIRKQLHTIRAFRPGRAKRTCVITNGVWQHIGLPSGILQAVGQIYILFVHEITWIKQLGADGETSVHGKTAGDAKNRRWGLGARSWNAFTGINIVHLFVPGAREAEGINDVGLCYCSLLYLTTQNRSTHGARV